MSTGTIDADGHIRDTEQHYREYLEAPYNKRGPVGVGLDAFDRAMFGSLGGPTSVDAQNWIDILDKAGMETTVLYPTIGLGVGFLNDPDYAAAFCRAYNNYVVRGVLQGKPPPEGCGPPAVASPGRIGERDATRRAGLGLGRWHAGC